MFDLLDLSYHSLVEVLVSLQPEAPVYFLLNHITFAMEFIKCENNRIGRLNYFENIKPFGGLAC